MILSFFILINVHFSTFGAIAHILKACIGTGVLAMPAAFKNSGLIAGVIGTIFAGFVCTHTVQLIVRIVIY